jgi:hypothetical protein
VSHEGVASAGQVSHEHNCPQVAATFGLSKCNCDPRQ